MDELEAAMKALSRRFQDRCERDRRELLGLNPAEPASRMRMRDIAHALAGAGGTLGFPDVTLRARDLEQAIDDQTPISAKLAALVETLSRCGATDLYQLDSLEQV